MENNVVDLDGLFSETLENPQTPAEETGDLGIALAEKKQPANTENRSLDEVYDQYLKRIYLFDVSGSMKDPVISDETIDSFEWSEFYLNMVRERIRAARPMVEKARQDLSNLLLNGGDPDASLDLLIDQLEIVLAEAPDEALVSDQTLKEYVIRCQMWQALGIPRKPGAKITRRIDLTVTSAKALIGKRFDQYPDADIVGIWFDQRAGVFGSDEELNPMLLPRKRSARAKILRHLTKEELLREIDILPSRCGGGTNILNAVTTAMGVIEAQPLPLQLHHIILITDAEDGSGYTLYEMLPQLKAKGIVLDFLHLCDPYSDRVHYQGYVDNATWLKKLCEATGGEYTRVTDTRMFELKFLQASSRKLLPPGAK